MIKPIVREGWVVAAEGAPPRFARRPRSGAAPWVVTSDAHRAELFDDVGAAAAARDHLDAQGGHHHSAPGGWRVVWMKQRMSFT